MLLWAHIQPAALNRLQFGKILGRHAHNAAVCGFSGHVVAFVTVCCCIELSTAAPAGAPRALLTGYGLLRPVEQGVDR